MVANIGATLAMGRFKFSPIGMWVPATKKEEYAGEFLGFRSSPSQEAIVYSVLHSNKVLRAVLSDARPWQQQGSPRMESKLRCD